MIIKVDTKKAKDRLSWNFIQDTLEKVGLLNSWTRNIMHGVETLRMGISWNKKQLDWFQPSKGIRQGEAISPYLFVLCMERLGHLIH